MADASSEVELGKAEVVRLSRRRSCVVCGEQQKQGEHMMRESNGQLWCVVCHQRASRPRRAK